MTALPQELAVELGGPCIPSFSLSFILFSGYLLSVCHVPGPVRGWSVMVCSSQSRR